MVSALRSQAERCRAGFEPSVGISLPPGPLMGHWAFEWWDSLYLYSVYHLPCTSWNFTPCPGRSSVVVHALPHLPIEDAKVPGSVSKAVSSVLSWVEKQTMKRKYVFIKMEIFSDYGSALEWLPTKRSWNESWSCIICLGLDCGLRQSWDVCKDIALGEGKYLEDHNSPRLLKAVGFAQLDSPLCPWQWTWPVLAISTLLVLNGKVLFSQLFFKFYENAVSDQPLGRRPKTGGRDSSFSVKRKIVTGW